MFWFFFSHNFSLKKKRRTYGNKQKKKALPEGRAAGVDLLVYRTYEGKHKRATAPTSFEEKRSSTESTLVFGFCSTLKVASLKFCTGVLLPEAVCVQRFGN